jgi:hypothetical protein
MELAGRRQQMGEIRRLLDGFEVLRASPANGQRGQWVAGVTA